MKEKSGVSLVEVVVALGLMGLLMLMMVEMMIKGNAYSTTLSGRVQEAPEIQQLINSIETDLRQGAYISPNSYDQRLEYTTYDTGSGNALKKIYIISGGNLTLSTSLNGGALTAAGSPYAISSATKYTVSGKFLYAWADNNCTDFTDTNSDGVWENGEGSAITTCPVGGTMSGPDATNPVPTPGSFVTKVDLQNFTFTTTNNSNTFAGGTVKRILPPDIFITVGPGYVRSTLSQTAPAASDSPLLNSFATNTANSLYGTSFNVSGLSWDSSRERLILVGGQSNIFLADRDGVVIGPYLGLNLNIGSAQLASVALESDYSTVLAMDTNASKLYQFPLKGNVPLNARSSVSVSTLTTPKSIAYDPSTPNDFYVVDANGSAWQVEERNIVTPTTLDGGPWALPAAFTSAHPPSGLTIDPISGDFLVVLNYVSSNTLSVYRIANGAETVYGSAYANDATVATYTFNTTTLGSTATTTNGNWGIAYDPDLNRFFLSDNYSDLVYEVVPPSLISQRS